jgi:hypothetical protein
MAAIRISGALRSSPSYALFTHINLPPLAQIASTYTFRATTQLATLPSTHQIAPMDMERIPAVQRHPSWKAAIEQQVNASRESATETRLHLVLPVLRWICTQWRSGSRSNTLKKKCGETQIVKVLPQKRKQAHRLRSGDDGGHPSTTP